MRAFLLLILIGFFTLAKGQERNDKRLTKRLVHLVNGFGGDVGVYVKNLRTGKTVRINADSVFPTASIVKISIAVGIMDKIAQGQIAYHQEFVYNDSMLYPGVDILGSYKNGEKIELSKLLMLMLSTSDNTASLWLQSLAGTGTRVNAIMDSLHFPELKVNSRTPGREAAREQYGWGQMTPRAMATLLEAIYRQQIISPAASNRLLRLLNRNYWDAEALSQIPPHAAVYSKNGAVNASRSEVVLVRGKKSEYLFCIATKNNKDESWEKTSEAWVLTRKLSSLLWHYFEKDGWKSAPGAEKYE
jgi:beta-lactamase class A